VCTKLQALPFALRRYAYRWEWRPGKLPVVKLEPPSAAKNKSARLFHGMHKSPHAAAGPAWHRFSGRGVLQWDDAGPSTGIASRNALDTFCVTAKTAACHVFHTPAVPRRSGPRRAYERVETEPGLHTFAEDAPGAGTHPKAFRVARQSSITWQPTTFAVTLVCLLWRHEPSQIDALKLRRWSSHRPPAQPAKHPVVEQKSALSAVTNPVYGNSPFCKAAAKPDHWHWKPTRAGAHAKVPTPCPIPLHPAQASS